MSAHKKTYWFFLIAVPVVLIVLHFTGISALSILDVREFLPFTFDADNQPEARGKGLLSTIMILSVIGFLTSMMCLLILGYKKISNSHAS